MWTVRYEFRDNNGRSAYLTLHPRGALSGAQIDAAVADGEAFLAPLTNAQIVGARATRAVAWTPVIRNDPAADVGASLVVIFRNSGQAIGTWQLPSPGILPFDVEGPYRDIRLARASLDVSGLLGPLESAAAATVFPDGTIFPNNYTVGGRTKV